MLIATFAQRGIETWWAPFLAFVAGAVSCASPCVLPLIPGYVAFVSGGEAPQARTREAVVPILLFILGFTVTFTLVFGLAASSISRWLRLPVGQKVAGGFVLAFGLFMVLYALQVRIPGMYREGRPMLARVRPGRAGAFPLGMAFAIGWTPCIGPVLGVILTLAAAQGGTVRSLLLLFLYSLGLGLPLILIGIGMRWAIRASRFLSRNYRYFAGAGGVVMAVIGVLLITGVWVRLLAPLLRVINRFTPPI